ncbi:MAG: hypothetical protein OXG08_00375 [Gammaproteobacteria bacterium]|nr:hypothetical protein [Gammaproteobacteria bacterium]
MLCADGLVTYRNLSWDAEAAVRVVVLGHRRKKLLPIVNQSLKRRFSLARVNALYTHLKSFVNEQARAVLTRYLQVYLGWSRPFESPCSAKA